MVERLVADVADAIADQFNCRVASLFRSSPQRHLNVDKRKRSRIKTDGCSIQSICMSLPVSVYRSSCGRKESSFQPISNDLVLVMVIFFFLLRVYQFSN